jgi:hypothetical protein
MLQILNPNRESKIYNSYGNLSRWVKSGNYKGHDGKCIYTRM